MTRFVSDGKNSNKTQLKPNPIQSLPAPLTKKIKSKNNSKKNLKK